MRIYFTTDFEGHYPVGTSAVIVAQDKGHARRLLEKELKKCGLKLRGFCDMKVTYEEIDLTISKAIVLQDGEY